MRLGNLYKNKTDQWATPRTIYQHYIDLGYTDFNPLKENYKNSLLLPHKNYYCNPPYSNIEPFIDYMIENTKKGYKAVLLLPVRLNTNWFIKLLIQKVKIIIIGRINYNDYKINAPFDSMIVEMNPNIKENTISFDRKYKHINTINNIQLTLEDI